MIFLGGINYMDSKETNKIDISQTDGYKKAYTNYFKNNIDSVGIQVAKSDVEVQTEGLLLDSKLKKEEYKLRENMAHLAFKIALANERDACVRQQQRVKLREFSPIKSFFFYFISVLALLLSCYMSISSISHLYTLYELTGVMQSRYWLPCCIMVLAQIVATVLSFKAYELKQYYKREALTAAVLCIFIFGISVFLNHSYLCATISENITHGYGIILGWFMAILPDCVALFFIQLPTQIKYCMHASDSIADEISEKSLISMFFENMTHKLSEKIRKRWYTNMEIRQKNREKFVAYSEENALKDTNVTKKYGSLNKRNVQNYENSISLKAAFCEQYREKILKFDVDEEVNRVVLNIDDAKDWRRVREYFCANGLLYCEGRGKPVKRSDKIV